jgi:hypothetical protein
MLKKAKIGMSLTQCLRQIKVRQCVKENFFIAATLWLRHAIKTVVRDTDKGLRLFRPPQVEFVKWSAAIFLDMSSWCPFRGHQEYVSLATHVGLLWRKLPPEKISEVKLQINFLPDDAPAEELNTSRKVLAAYLVSTLREALGAFEPQRLPRATVTPEMKIIAYEILDGACHDHSILADAAEDAGYTFAPVLNHLRGHKGQQRPCWAALALLNKHPLSKDE